MKFWRIVVAVCFLTAMAETACAVSTTLTFDEVAQQVANDGYFGGVTFHSSYYLYYNYASQGTLTGLTIPYPYSPFNYPDGSLVGPSGYLDLDFADATSMLGLDLAVWSYNGPMAGDISLSLFDSENRVTGVYDLFGGNVTSVQTNQTAFHYDGAPVSRARLDFQMYGSGFFEPSFDMDNLSFDTHPTPEPSTVILLSLGLVGMIGYAAHRKRLEGDR